MPVHLAPNKRISVLIRELHKFLSLSLSLSLSLPVRSVREINICSNATPNTVNTVWFDWLKKKGRGKEQLYNLGPFFFFFFSFFPPPPRTDGRNISFPSASLFPALAMITLRSRVTRSRSIRPRSRCMRRVATMLFPLSSSPLFFSNFESEFYRKFIHPAVHHACN